MARYIDADKLLEEMTVNVLPNNAQFVYLAMRGMVRNAPTADVVEVVRCKDCKKYVNGKCDEIEWFMDGYFQGTFEMRQPDDYCSRGERKDT